MSYQTSIFDRIQVFDTERLLRTLHDDIYTAIDTILDLHQGREHAIPRKELLRSLREAGFEIEDRALRAAISHMRKQGDPNSSLIGSAPGVNGGYYKLLSDGEFDDFSLTEYAAKIRDMQETLAAMRSAARKKWGGNGQIRLF